MNWAAQIVECLLEQREAGVTDFALAWRRAVATCPRPKDWCLRGKETDEGWLPFSTFFREACWREWHGMVSTDFAGLRAMLADSALVGRDEISSRSRGGRIVLIA